MPAIPGDDASPSLTTAAQLLTRGAEYRPYGTPRNHSLNGIPRHPRSLSASPASRNPAAPNIEEVSLASAVTALQSVASSLTASTTNSSAQSKNPFSLLGEVDPSLRTVLKEWHRDYIALLTD